MAKAVFSRRFDASDTKKGISIRVEASDEAQPHPEWVVKQAEEAGAAKREPSAASAAKSKD